MFHSVMVHPVDVAQLRDLAAVYLKGVDNYNNYNPGPLLSSSDPSAPLLPKALIFVVCATTLAFCTYVGYGYFS